MGQPREGGVGGRKKREASLDRYHAEEGGRKCGDHLVIGNTKPGKGKNPKGTKGREILRKKRGLLCPN